MGGGLSGLGESSTRDTASRCGQGVQAGGTDGLAAPLAPAVRPGRLACLRSLHSLHGRSSLGQQCQYLLALEGDGRAFGVVLVVGIGAH